MGKIFVNTYERKFFMSGSIKKVTTPIINSIGGAGGFLSQKTDTSALEDLIKYYQNYDTSLADGTLQNMGSTALDLSTNLPDYISSVDTSDTARNDAQNAVWNAYQSLLTPQHETQTSDLNTRLLNQGLTVGSEAYQRAMNDLTQKQNLALNQAAYKAVSEGNDVYETLFDQSLEKAKLNNTVRKDQLKEIYDYTEKAKTDLDIQEKIFSAQQDLSKADTHNNQMDVNALLSLMSLI